MEEYKKRLEDLNEDEIFTSAISYEDDQRYILNTEKWISYEEGVQENQVNFIKNMYKQNIPIEEIATIAELPLEKIKEILEIK